eukprot:TRINITY_DN7586_c0_g1_i1.p1 TRINITY_DN7586_c0_g1~~TRINITY_DN7586_c0_g1_i1.p1  ORF type:complete len:438 (-),score=130.06 TRINITY_DN7586_c0_g1_i1:98-1411(-)
MTKTFTAPPLPIAQLLQLLNNDIQVQVTNQDLTEPQPEHIRALYEHFLELCVGITKEDLQQVPFEQLELLEHREIHEEGIIELNHIRELQRLMDACLIPDFSLKEIQAPTKQSVQKILSSIINFARFREDHLPKFQDLSSQQEEYLVKRDELQLAHEELTTKLVVIKQARADDEPEVQQHTATVQQLGLELRKLAKSAEELKKKLETRKAEAVSVQDKINRTKLQTTASQQEASRYTSQIVRSPDRMKKEIADMAQTLDTEKATVLETERRSREMSAKLDSLTKSDKDLHKCIRTLSECDLDIQKCKSILKSAKTHQHTVAEVSTKTRDLATQEANGKRQIKNAEERLFRQQKQQELRKLAAEEALTAAQTQCAAMEKENGAASTKASENFSKARQVRVKTQQLLEAHKLEMEQWQGKIGKLTSELNAYHDRLLGAM